MTNVILQPASNKQAQKHYLKTVATPRNLNEIGKFLTEFDFNALKNLTSNKEVSVWGATNGSAAQWRKISPNDIVLFYKDGRFFSIANIIYTCKSSQLAQSLWGAQWQYIYFTDKPTAVNIHRSEVFTRIPSREWPNSYLQNMVVYEYSLVESVLAKYVSDHSKYIHTEITESKSNEFPDGMKVRQSRRDQTIKQNWFNKKSKYSRFEIYKTATGKDTTPPFDFARTGYGRIDDDLFIFMNIGTPGRGNIDYKNSYDDKTESVSWCAKKNTNSKHPLMQRIINGEMNLYVFARWERDEVQFTYLGKGYVISYEDNVAVADKDGKDAICMEYQLTCKQLEEDLNHEDIESGILIFNKQQPKGKIKHKRKSNFKGRKPKDYLLKAQKDKKIGDLGEMLVLHHEKQRLTISGQSRLIDAIEHTSQIEGDGTGYDIKSYNEDGTVRFIEVKTTKFDIDTEFYMSPNEIEFSKLHKNNYFLYRVYDLKTEPLQGTFYIKEGDISDQFVTEPIEFRMYPK